MHARENPGETGAKKKESPMKKGYFASRDTRKWRRRGRGGRKKGGRE
jgi:hypothetical protein